MCMLYASIAERTLFGIIRIGVDTQTERREDISKTN